MNLFGLLSIVVLIIVSISIYRIRARTLPVVFEQGKDKILVIDGIDYAHYKHQYDDYLKQFKVLRIQTQYEFECTHYFVQDINKLIDCDLVKVRVLPTNLVMMATAFEIVEY